MAPRRVVQKATTNLKSLPIELVIVILHEAQYDDLLPRYKWLKNYSLVCHAWSIHAQQLLYAHVALLQGTLHCRAFLRAVASARVYDPARAAPLQGAIHTLALTVDHQDIYADVLALCPRLRELHLSLFHASFRPEVLRRLAHPDTRLHRVCALRVRTFRYQTLFQLLPLFPGVEYLEIDCNSVVDGALELPPPSTSAPPAWHLHELRYTNLRRETHAFVDWTLSGPAVASRDTLEVLRVGCRSFQVARLAVLGVARTLRSLSIVRLEERDEAVLADMAGLEEIAVAQLHGPAPPFKSLPSAVAHIALDAMSKDECAAVLAGIASYCERTGAESAEPPLKTITYNRRSDEDTDALEDVRVLYGFCEERGIEFWWMDPPYGYYAGERFPLAQVRTFPRPLTAKGKVSFTRRFVGAAKKVFASTSISPVSLARP